MSITLKVQYPCHIQQYPCANVLIFAEYRIASIPTNYPSSHVPLFTLLNCLDWTNYAIEHLT